MLGCGILHKPTHGISGCGLTGTCGLDRAVTVKQVNTVFLLSNYQNMGNLVWAASRSRIGFVAMD